MSSYNLPSRSNSAIRAALVAAALSLAASLAPAWAQISIPIRFNPGASGTTINGTVRGNEFVDYELNAREGQTMMVSLEVTGTNGFGTVYFNIVPAGQDYPALYVGSQDDDNRAQVILPSSGDWAIRVYQMGNDKDADKTSGFTIDVSIAAGGGGSAAAPGGDFADGMAGGPDFWDVQTPGDTLNLRSGPETGNRVIARLPHGLTVRNLGCEMNGDTRWCHVATLADPGYEGWVAGRYLVEARNYPTGAATQLPASPSDHAERLQFTPGTSGASVTATLMPEESRRFVLNARNGQMMLVSVATAAPDVRYLILNPDNTYLLDMVRAEQAYKGQLWQSGDHIVEVVNRGRQAATFNLYVGIE